MRAPEVAFAAAEIGLDAFGYNIENRHLLAALFARAVGDENLRALPVRRSRSRAMPPASPSSLPTARRGCSLAIGADGQRSLCRAAAGIGTQRRAYPQTALTLNLAHARPHHDTSTEFHTESGPFTLVPLPGRRSSLVCVLDPATRRRACRENRCGACPPRSSAARIRSSAR